ncbi:hypothetical protein EGJ48_03365 [Pantoea dispersa]|uniref:hypothetical protein n=1 Tax=Pantoea dispersa TaxID=59814 RepID=UPI000F68FBA9|nr:hypothetical protein [Pantoea dispersa]RRW77598.1 hypothetical protein EGJ48_03365 [Pantoea dispersa]
MKKQELFLWGVQAILSSGTMQAAEVWTIKKLSLEALAASERIPRRLSVEQAVDAFYMHIVSVKGGDNCVFSAW